MPNFGLTFVFHILKNHHLSLFAKRMFCKNGSAKGKNESATTAIQEYFLFAWLYYSIYFHFVNRISRIF